MKKKLSAGKRAILICVCLIAFFILLENIIVFTLERRNDILVKKEYEKKQEEYKNTEKYQQETNLESAIEKIMNSFNNDDYETLFTQLDDAYKIHMGINDVEAFKKYIEERFGNPKTMILSEFKSLGNGYSCVVQVRNENMVVKRNIFIGDLDNEKLKLMFGEIVGSQQYPSNFVAQNQITSYRLKYKILFSGGYKGVFEITNTSQKSVNGSLEKTNIMATDKRVYNVVNSDELKNITLEPNETKTLVYEIDTTEAGYFEEYLLNLVFTDSNGSDMKSQIVLKDIHY